MYEFYKQCHAVYEQYKDWIIPIGFVMGLLTRYFWDRIKETGAWAWSGLKACWLSRKPIELVGDSRDIVYNIMKADAYDANGVIYLGCLCYHPDGSIKRRYYSENVDGTVYEPMLADVPLDKNERKALKAVHKTKLAELKQIMAYRLRFDATEADPKAFAPFLDGTLRVKGKQRTSRKGSLIIVDEETDKMNF